MSCFKSSAILAAALFGSASLASAAVVNFQDGVSSYNGTQDVSLYAGGDSGANTGTLSAIFTDGPTRSRGLLKFDVSSLAGQTVSSASITLTTAATSGTGNSSFSVYALSDANASWVQGTKFFAAAGAGEPAWDYRSNPTSWAGSAGASTPTTDFDPTPVATGVFSLPAVDGVGINLTLPASLVQHWIDNTNAGLLIVSDVNLKIVQFYSSEVGNSAWRPLLTVDAQVIPEPGTATVLGLAGAGLIARRRK